MAFDIVARIQTQLLPGQVEAVYSKLRQGLSNVTADVKIGGTSQAVQGLQATRTAATAASASLKDLAVSSGRTRAELQATAKVTLDATNFMTRLGAQAGLAARRFAAFSAGTVAIVGLSRALREGASEAVHFDRVLTKLAQLSTTGGRDVAGIAQDVGRLSQTMGVSSRSLVEVAEQLRQTGLSARDTREALGSLAEASLAPSFGRIKDLTQGAVSVMRQFNIEAKDLGATLGSINQVASTFAVEAEDLVTAGIRAGGAFRAAGGDFREFAGLFTSIRSTTRESAEAISTGLRTVFSRIQRGDVVQHLHDMGIELRHTAREAEALGRTDLTGKFVGAFEATRRISESLRNLSPNDSRYSSIVEQLGGQREVSRVIPLIQQFEVAQRAAAVATAGTVSNTIAAQQAQGSLEVQLQKTKEAWLGVVRELVTSNGFKSVASSTLELASGLAEVAKQLKPLLPLATAFVGLRLAQGIGGIVSGRSNPFSSFGTAFFAAPGSPIRRAGGGLIPGSGMEDTVDAKLSPGEYVLKRSAVRALGVGTLDRLNNVQRFAEGGLVGSTPPRYTGGIDLNRGVVAQGFGTDITAGGLPASVRDDLIAKAIPVIERIVGGRRMAGFAKSLGGVDEAFIVALEEVGRRAETFDPSKLKEQIGPEQYQSYFNSYAMRSARQAVRRAATNRSRGEDATDFSDPLNRNVATSRELRAGDEAQFREDYRRHLDEEARRNPLARVARGAALPPQYFPADASGVRVVSGGYLTTSQPIAGSTVTDAEFSVRGRSLVPYRPPVYSYAFDNGARRREAETDDFALHPGYGGSGVYDFASRTRRTRRQARLAADRARFEAEQLAGFGSYGVAGETAATSPRGSYAERNFPTFRRWLGYPQEGQPGTATGGFGPPRPTLIDRTSNFLGGPGGQALGIAALIGTPYLAEAIRSQGGTAEAAVGGRQEGSFRNASGAGGFLSGAGVGGVVGGSLGSAVLPGIGTAIGAAAGAFVGGVTGMISALRDAEKEIRDVKIGNTLTTLAGELQSLVTTVQNPNTRTLSGAAGSIEQYRRQANDRARAEATGFFGGFSADAFAGLQQRNLRQDLGNQLPQLVQFLNARADQAGRRGTGTTDQIAGGFASSNQPFIRLAADIQNKSVDEVVRDLRRTIESGRNANRVEQANRDGRSAEERVANGFGRLALNVDAAASSLLTLRQRSSLLSDLFEGSLNAHHATINGEALTQLGRNDNAALDPLRAIANITGQPGRDLLQTGTAANDLARILPAVVSSVAASNPRKGADVSTAVAAGIREQLGFTAGNTPAAVQQGIAAITHRLEEVMRSGGPGSFFEAVRSDPSKLSHDLLSGFSDPIVESGRRITHTIDQEFGEFATGIGRFNVMLQRVGEGRDQLVTLQTNRFRAETEIQARQDHQIGRLSDFLPLDVLQRPFQSRLERLTGFAGNAATDPARIGTLLRGTNTDILRLREQQQSAQASGDTTRFRASTESLSRLQLQANSLTAALRGLTDVSQRNAAIQERLARIEGERSGRLDLAERVAGADPEEQLRIARGFNLATQAATTRGGLDNFTADDRRSILDALNSTRGVTLSVPGRGEITGEDLKRELLGNFAGGAFQLPPNLRNEEPGLQRQLIANMASAEQAMHELIETEKTNADHFYQTLDDKFGSFLSRLSGVFLVREQLTTTQREQGVAANRVRELGQSSEQASLLGRIGIRTTGQLQNARNLETVLTQFGGANQELSQVQATGQSIRGSLANGSILRFLRAQGADLAIPFSGGISGNLAENLREHLQRTFPGITPDESGRLVAGVERRVRADGYNSPLHNTELNQPADLARFFNDHLRSAVEEEFGGAVNGTRSRNAIIRRNEARQQLGQAGINADQLENVNIDRVVEAVRALSNNGQRLEDLGGATEQARQHLERLTATVATLEQQLQRNGGAVPAQPHALGGPIFQARGTDTVPAMLSPNEFVVNAASAQANRGLLERINAAHGRVSYLADGGAARQQQIVNREEELRILGRQDRPDLWGMAAIEHGRRLLAERGRLQFQGVQDRGGAGAQFLGQQQAEGFARLTLQRQREQEERTLAHATRLTALPNPAITGGTEGQLLSQIRSREILNRNRNAGRRFINAYYDRRDAFAEADRRSHTFFGRFMPGDAEAGRRAHKEAIVRHYAGAQLHSYYAQQEQSNLAGQQLIASHARAANNPYNKLFGLRFDESQDRIAMRVLGVAAASNAAAARHNSVLQDYRRSLHPFGFATGGIVPGAGGIDDVPARLSSGEGVLTRSAVARIGGPNAVLHLNQGGVVGQTGSSSTSGFGEGATTFANAASSLVGGFGQFASTTASIMQGFTQFAGHSVALTDAMARFPRELTANHTHQVNVRLDNAEILSRLTPQLEAMVVAATSQQLTRMFREHLPEAGVSS